MAADPRQRLPHRVQFGRGGAGDAGDRDVIDETRRTCQHCRQAGVVGGRRGQIDHVDIVGSRRAAQLGGFLGRQVDDDQAVDPGRSGVVAEALGAVSIDRVVIAHQDHRRIRVLLAEFRHHLQRAGQGGAVLQSTLGGQLDHRPVGHRIGEGQAQFDQIGAGGRQPVEDRLGGGTVGIAGRDEGDQPGAAFLLERGETGGNPAHFTPPMAAVTVARSLSPRPDRLTTIR